MQLSTVTKSNNQLNTTIQQIAKVEKYVFLTGNRIYDYVMIAGILRNTKIRWNLNNRTNYSSTMTKE